MIRNARWRWRPRHGWVLSALVAVFAATFAPAAAAADNGLQGNARFVSAGHRVVDYSAAGIGCRVFGFCDDVNASTVADATTRRRSARDGEPLVVICTVGRGGPLYRVLLDLDGDSTLDGLTAATGVTVDPDVRLAPC